MLTLPIKIALITGAATALLAPTSAFADPCGGGKGLNCGIGGGTGGGSGGSGGGSGGGGGDGGGVEQIPIDPDPGVGGGGGQPGGGGAGPAPAPVNTWDLAEQARSSAALPKVEVHTLPGTRTYVQLSTRLWVEGFDPVETEPISAGGQTVQAFATPVSVDWDLGETQIHCEKSACSYTYRRSSARASGGTYMIKATITWRARWICTPAALCDPDGAEFPEPLTASSEDQPLRVDEIQTDNRP